MRGDAEALPGVSIVSVALNAAAALPLTLESAIAQDYPDTEIIVVDGGSWDATGPTLRRYADVVDRIVVAEDAGIYYAMNDALGHATKDYVIFMNAGDQFYSADSISRMITARDGDPDVIYGDHVYVDAGLELFKRAAPFDWLTERLAVGRIDGIWIDRIPCHQATFLRTDLLRRLRFDTRLRVTADHDVLFRAHAAGAQMQYVDEVVCHYFGGGLSATAGARTRLEGASVYRRYSDRPDLVDRVLFPAGSPFSPETLRTGLRLGGFGSASEGTRLSSAGGEMMTPERESLGLHLHGNNEGADGIIAVQCDDAIVAEAIVSTGPFSVDLVCDRILPPATIIRLVPTRRQAAEASPDEVNLRIDGFRFLQAVADLPNAMRPGTSLDFTAASATDIAPLLGHGWADPEPTHLWSIGERSELWLRLTPDARRLRLFLDGSPYAPDGRQSVAVLLNGREIVRINVDRGINGVLEVDCGQDGWRRDAANRLTLCPSSFAPSGEEGDTRQLGCCLWRLEVD